MTTKPCFQQLLEADDLSERGWDVFDGVAAAAPTDDVARRVAARVLAALGPRDYLLLVQSRLAEPSLPAEEWSWLVGEAANALGAMSPRAAAASAPGLARTAWRGAPEDAEVVARAATALARALAGRPETACCAVFVAVRLGRWDLTPLVFVGELLRICATAGADLDVLLSHGARFRRPRLGRPKEEDESAESASSDSSQELSSDDDDDDDGEPATSLAQRGAQLRKANSCRWSATGVARFIARLELAGLLPWPWSKQHRARLLAPVAARLASLPACREGCMGCATDGARLALLVAADAPHCTRRTLARRALRVATRYADGVARSDAKKSLSILVAFAPLPDRVGLLRGLLETTSGIVEDPGAFDRRGEAGALAEAARNGLATATALDCLRAAISRDTAPHLDDLVADVLQTRLRALVADGRLGYDSLHANLDAHVAALTLARKVKLFGLSQRVLTEAQPGLADLALTLRRRLRRPREAANVPAFPEAVPTISPDATIDPGVVPPPLYDEDNDDRRRFLLNLIAENLDYILA